MRNPARKRRASQLDLKFINRLWLRDRILEEHMFRNLLLPTMQSHVRVATFSGPVLVSALHSNIFQLTTASVPKKIQFNTMSQTQPQPTVAKTAANQPMAPPPPRSLPDDEFAEKIAEFFKRHYIGARSELRARELIYGKATGKLHLDLTGPLVIEIMQSSPPFRITAAH